MEVTILMPCLNEAETIETCVRKAMSYLETSGIEGEVLISDNGSTDGSQAIAEALGARIVHAPEKGYGAALVTGIAEARGRYIIMGDSDDSYDFSALGPFVERLRSGGERCAVCGASTQLRSAPSNSIRKAWSLPRKW